MILKVKIILQKILFRMGYHIEKISRAVEDFPILRPLSTYGLEILADREFQASCKMIGITSLLDTPRLANLWMLCRMTDPDGAIAEIGTYRGGGALHLSNCCPKRQVVICDPFSKESFQKLEPQVDQMFHSGDFTDHSKEQVSKLFKGRNFRIIPGYFPESVITDKPLPKLSFIHLDVDVYHATKESLKFLLTQRALLAKSLIVLDDYNRGVDGVNKAVAEIVAEVPGCIVFPMFPGQALLIPPSWYAPL